MTPEARACSATPPWIGNPYRLVSLREILMQYADEEVFFTPFANALFALGYFDTVVTTDGLTISGRGLVEISVFLDICAREMERLGLRVAAKQAKELSAEIYGCATGKGDVRSPHDQVTILRSTLATEMESTVFLHVTNAEAAYYREPLDGVTEEVQERFSSTLDDLRESARCYALGRSAASVFHAMRAVEVALIALGRDLNVPSANTKNWQELLNEIGAAIKQVSEKTHGASWRESRQWYAEVSAQLHNFKDAWRNDVMHVHRSYNQSRAREILHATRAFMGQIATRLRE